MKRMKGIYNRDSILGFGKYEGYSLGVVFLFDSAYVDWCINTIDKFYIEDLDYLIEHKVIFNDVGYSSSSFFTIDSFNTYREFALNEEFNEECHFSVETINKNQDTGQLLHSINDNIETLMNEAGVSSPLNRSRYYDDSYELRSWDDITHEEMGEPPSWDAIDM